MMYLELQKTISINIFDFKFVPKEEYSHNRYRIINTRTCEDDLNQVGGRTESAD